MSNYIMMNLGSLWEKTIAKVRWLSLDHLRTHKPGDLELLARWIEFPETSTIKMATTWDITSPAGCPPRSCLAWARHRSPCERTRTQRGLGRPAAATAAATRGQQRASWCGQFFDGEWGISGGYPMFGGWKLRLASKMRGSLVHSRVLHMFQNF